MKLVLKKDCTEFEARLTTENYEDITLPSCDLVDSHFLTQAKKGDHTITVEFIEMNEFSFKENNEILSHIYDALSIEKKKLKRWEKRDIELSTVIIGNCLTCNQTLQVFQAIETSLYEDSSSLWAKKRNESFHCFNNDMKSHLKKMYPNYKPMELSYLNQCSNWFDFSNNTQMFFYEDHPCPWLHKNGVIFNNTKSIQNESQLNLVTLDLVKLANCFEYLNMMVIFLDPKKNTKFGLEIKLGKVYFHNSSETIEKANSFLLNKENTFAQHLTFTEIINKTFYNTNEYPLSIEDIHKIMEETHEIQK